MQSTECAVEGFGLFLSYGAIEKGEQHALRVANEIVDALQRHGLKTQWDGTLAKAIQVQLDWKRRFPQVGE